MDVFNPAFWTFIAIIGGIYGILALGLYVQFSLAGLPNFGHVAFMAVSSIGGRSWRAFEERIVEACSSEVHLINFMHHE